MKKFEKLNRAEMKNILGGMEPHTVNCTANCGLGTTVTCTGSNCWATDFQGCGADAVGTSAGQLKNCNSVIYF